MLDKKAIQLIKAFLGEKEMTVNWLAKETHQNKGVVLYTLEKINEFLEEHKQPQIQTDGAAVVVPEKLQAFFMKGFLTDAFFTDYLLDTCERQHYIFLMLFCQQEDYYSMNHFLVTLDISKTTFLGDLRKLQEALEAEKLTIANNRKQGYFIEGNESAIRSFMIRWVLDEYNVNQDLFFYDYFLWREKIESISQTKEYINKLFEEHQLKLPENRFQEFCCSFTLLLPRLAAHPIQTMEYHDFEVFKQTKEYRVAAELLTHWGIISSSADFYVCTWLLSLSMSSVEEETYDRSIILELVTQMTERFELLSGSLLANKNQVIENLYSHFRAVYYRLFFNIPIINTLSERVYQEYPRLIHIIEEALKPISDLFEFPIPKEEIAYLFMHFWPAIENQDDLILNKKVGAVVCPNGVGSSAMVIGELQKLFPEYDFIGPFAVDTLKQMTIPFDAIFSTIQNIQLYTLKKPVFLVSPMMSVPERYDLMRTVYVTTKSLPLNYPKVSELVTVIEKTSTIHDREALEKGLYQLLVQPAKKIVELPPNDLRLSDILTPNRIILHAQETSFIDAVRNCGSVLLREKVITPSYLEKIEEIIQENPRSMMITDQIALPHTRPVYGAQKVGMSCHYARSM